MEISMLNASSHQLRARRALTVLPPNTASTAGGGSGGGLKGILKPARPTTGYRERNTQLQWPAGVWGRLLPLGGSLLGDSAAPTDLAASRFACGRKPTANLRLESGLVSGTHFRLRRTATPTAVSGKVRGARHASVVVLKDESTNGVLLNGMLLGKGNSATLKHGDSIALPKQLASWQFLLRPLAEDGMAGGSAAVAATVARARAQRIEKKERARIGRAVLPSRPQRAALPVATSRVLTNANDAAYSTALRCAAEQHAQQQARAESRALLAGADGGSGGGSALLALPPLRELGTVQLMAREKLSQAQAPSELVGTRILVDGVGLATVLDWQKGSFLGFGPSRHLLQLDVVAATAGGARAARAGPKPETWCVLRRNDNGGERFIEFDETLLSARLDRKAAGACGHTLPIVRRVAQELGFGFGAAIDAADYQDEGAALAPSVDASQQATAACACSESECESENESAGAVDGDATGVCDMTAAACDATACAEHDDSRGEAEGIFGAIARAIFGGAAAGAAPDADAECGGLATCADTSVAGTGCDDSLALELERQHDASARDQERACARALMLAMHTQLRQARGATLAGLMRHRVREHKCVAFTQWKWRARDALWRPKLQQELHSLTSKFDRAVKKLEASPPPPPSSSSPGPRDN
eukprot:g1593.t1